MSILLRLNEDCYQNNEQQENQEASIIIKLINIGTYIYFLTTSIHLRYTHTVPITVSLIYFK